MKLTTHMAGQIRIFMDNFDQVCYRNIEAVPCEVCKLRSSLIREEAKEYQDSVVRTTDELDALVDSLYVIIGTNLALAVPVEPYNSGQIKVDNILKQAIFSQVKNVTDELDTLFPCPRRTYEALRALTARVMDIATMVGYDLHGAFDEVHRSNMTKLWDDEEVKNAPANHSITKKPLGYIVRRADGKIIKPPSFSPPNLMPFLCRKPQSLSTYANTY